MDPVDVASLPPEYVNASNAGRIVGVVGAFHFLALAFVSLRIYVRVFMIRAFGIDDALIVVAYLLALMAWICLVLQVPYGLGRHSVVVSVEDRIKLEQIAFWKAFFAAGIGLGLLRISMAISLLRLNKDLKWYRWSLYATMAFVVAYTIQADVWLFVYCTPYSGWWEFQWMNPFDPRCHDFNIFINLVYWNVSCNIFTDVLLGALPVPIIWRLKMKLRVRLYVIAILNLGYLAVLMGVLKAIFMFTTGGNPDNIFEYWLHVWENLQFNIGIMAACASFLKPLVGRFLKIDSTVGHSNPSNRYYRHNGRTPFGVETIGGGYSHKRRANMNRLDDDEFELHTKDVIGAEEHQMVTRVQGTRSRLGPSQNTSSDAVYAGQSDTNSEEMILQRPDRGIVMTRDVSVRYTNQ